MSAGIGRVNVIGFLIFSRIESHDFRTIVRARTLEARLMYQDEKPDIQTRSL